MENIFVEKRVKAAVLDDWGMWEDTTDTAPFHNTSLIQYRVNTLETIRLQKRTRALVTDEWDEWDDTNDASPYETTSLVQYRLVTSETIADELANEGEEAADYSINIEDITANVTVSADHVVSGDGVFDDIMETVNKHIKAEYDANRITTTDYSTVYLGALQSVLTESMKFALEKDNAGLKAKVTEKNSKVLDAQASLYARQEAGFDDNKHQKILDTQMNAWNITFQDTDTTFIPKQIGQEGFDTAFRAAAKNYKRR